MTSIRTNMRVGVDWNNDGVIYWGEDATLDFIRILYYNEYGTSDQYGSVANVPQPATGTAGTFTANGFDLSWVAGTAGGTATNIIVMYDDVGIETLDGTFLTYTKTYSDLEKAEDISEYVTDMSWTIGLDNVNQFVATEGKVNIQLVNTDRTFSPEYESSALYGYLVPNRRTIVEMYDNTNAEWVREWSGVTATFAPGVTKRKPFTDISCVQGLSLLDKIQIPPQLQTDNYTGENIALLLTNWYPAGATAFRLNTAILEKDTFLSTIATDIEQGIRQQEYYNEDWLTVDEEAQKDRAGFTPVLNRLEDLVMAEDGLFYVSEDAVPTFKTRTTLFNDALTSTALDVDTEGISGSYVYGEDAGLINKIKADWHSKEYYPVGSEVFTKRIDKELENGDTRKYEVNTNADKITLISVSNVTVNATGGSPSVSYMFSEDNRTSVTVTITNSTGSDVTINSITIYGEAIQSVKEEAVVEDVLNSIQEYLVRSKTYTFRELTNQQAVESFTQTRLNLLAWPRGRFPTVSLVDKSNAIQEKQLSIRMGDTVKVSEYQTAVEDKQHVVIGKRGRWQPGLFTMTFVLSDVLYERGWVLEIDTLDETTYV